MQIDAFFKKMSLPLSGKTLVVAVSGGPDSMALLDMLNAIKKKYQFKLVAAHLDHQLRLDSFHETEIISKYCYQKKIKLVKQKWPTKLHPESGIEEAAREYRYTFLLQVARDNMCDYLLTAHHCDDLLENILLKLIRSGNPREMNSLQAVSDFHDVLLLRPLLTVEKTELLEYDYQKNIAFIVDETNNQDDVLRNRLRHNVVPLLKRENSAIGKNALRFSQQLNLMTSLVEKHFTQLNKPEKFLGVAYRITRDSLCSLSAQEKNFYWQSFIWHNWHIRVNENLANFELITYQDYFYLLKSEVSFFSKAKLIQLDQSFSFGKRSFFISTSWHKNPLIGEFYAAKNIVLSVGSLTNGTKLLLKNGQHVKSKKKFAQSGIPSALRQYCLTVYGEDRPIFIEQTYSNQYVPTDSQKYYVYINN
jgi:tRNA(Ile)-lysidine synthase